MALVARDTKSLSLFSKPRPSARALAVARLVGGVAATGVGAVYLAASATPQPGARPVVVPVAAATHASLAYAAAQQDGASPDSGLLRLAARVKPAMLQAAALQTSSPFRLADPAAASHDLDWPHAFRLA